jgi:hypothetical protein
LIELLTKLLARFPKLGGLFGLLFALAFGYTGFASWEMMQRMPRTPERLSLSEAASRASSGEDLWVEIASVKWDCRNVVYTRLLDQRTTDTEVIFTDERAAVLGVALFRESRRLSCEDLPDTNVTGVLSRMGDTFYERMPKRGFDIAEYENAATRVRLCTFCGRPNSVGLVILAVIFVPLGLSMYPICLAMRKQYRDKGLL